MKVIIAGSRSISPSLDNISQALFMMKWSPTEIVSGCCPKGADRAGECWAEYYKIPIKRFPADWDTYQKGAGPIRNRQMAFYADALLAYWDGISRGTKNMVTLMHNLGKHTYTIMI